MKRTLLGAVALTTATVATIATTIPSQASAGTTGTPGFVAPGGTIKFEVLNGVPSVDYYPPSTSASAPTIRPLAVSSKCAVLNLTAPATVGSTTYAPVSDVLSIAFTGTGSAGVSYYGGDLGVYTGSSNCNANAGKVGLGGTITLKPGSMFAGQSFLSAGVVVGQHNQAGLYWVASNGSSQVAANTNALQGPASSGNSSASNDNTVVSINPTDTTTTPPTYHAFNTVTLQPTGSNSNAIIDLSPGDVPGDTPTTFQMGQSQEYSVDCSSANTVVSNNSASGDSAQSASFTRLANGYNPAKDSNCYKIGVTVTINQGAYLLNGVPTDTVTVNNTTTSASGIKQQVHATVQIVWQVSRYYPAGTPNAGQLRSPSDMNAALATYIQWTPGGPLTPVEWCGRALGATDIGAPGPSHPSDAAWCMTNSESHISGDYVIQTETYDGEGDPNWIK